MKTVFFPRGVCSQRYEIDIENGMIRDIIIEGGCNGNLKGIAALVEGKSAEEIIPIISGITCGFKSTSCPDQLAHALHEALNQ